MKTTGFIKTLVLALITIGLHSCMIDVIPRDFIRYDNQSDKDIVIEAYFDSSKQPTYIEILNGDSFTAKLKESTSTGTYYLWYKCDSAFVYYNAERVQRFLPTPILPDKPNPLSSLHYTSQYIESKNILYYVFTFTREMYDAATPIEK